MAVGSEQTKQANEWRQAWIGLGANLGPRREAIRRAVDLLDGRDDCRVAEVSPTYETAARIVEDQPPFINACAELQTTMPPAELMSALLAVEAEMGRDRTESKPKGPRMIDLDLLVYEDEVVDQPGLTIPHPGLRERAFVLEPLCDIAPELSVPPDGKTVRQLRDECEDSLE